MRKYALLLVVILAWLATGLAVVRPDERAVVRRFGRVIATPGPGLWVGAPWGIDRVDRYRVQTVRQLAVGFETSHDGGPLLTGDQNLIDVRLVLESTIDPAKLAEFAVNEVNADAVLAREAGTLAAEWAAGQSVDDSLLAGRAELPRWLAAKLPERLAPHGIGLVLQRASVEHLAAPAEVRDAFDAVNQAQAEVRTRETVALREADQRRQAAKSVEFQQRQAAEAYRAEQQAAAKADADAFLKRLTQYRSAKASNPEALAAIWWEEMGRTLRGLKGRGRVDVLDAHIGKDGLDVTQFAPKK